MSGTECGCSELELTHRVFVAASARDFDAMLDVFDAESVWDVSPFGLGVHVGVPAIRRFLELWIDSFDEWEIRPWMLLELGNGVIHTAAEQSGRTKGSRELFRLRQASVFVWRGGVLARVAHFQDLDAGRDAATRLAEAEPAVRAP